MTLQALLRRLAALGVTLTVRGDRLRVAAPAGALLMRTLNVLRVTGRLTTCPRSVLRYHCTHLKPIPHPGSLVRL